MAVELLYPRPPLRTISQAQYDQFHSDGYLVLPGVLSQAEIDRVAPAIDQLWERELAGSDRPDRSKRFDGQGVLHEDRVFVEFIDHPSMFGAVLDIMGPYIQLGRTIVQALW